MGSHEEFLELCASATAGELTAEERTRLEAHLAGCPDCRRAMREYEIAARTGVAALAPEFTANEKATDDSWSIEEAERTLFKRLDAEGIRTTPQQASNDEVKSGQRFTYRPSQIRWREIWMPFAAAVLLALALGIASYRTGVKRGTDIARTVPAAPKDSVESLAAQASDAGHERAQLLFKLEENAETIADLKVQLSEQLKVVNGLKAAGPPRSTGGSQQDGQIASDARVKRDEELAAAQAKLADLQKTVDLASTQRDEVANRATA